MKSACLPGSEMLPDSACSSSESSGGKRHHLLEVVLYVPLQRVDLETIVPGHDVFRGADGRAQERLGGTDPVQRDAGQPLNDQPQAAIRQLEHLVDVRDRADAVEIVLAGLFDRSLALREDAHELIALYRGLDEPYGTLAGHRQRHERAGKQHRVTKRENGQFRRDRQLTLSRRRPRCVRMARFVVHPAAPDAGDTLVPSPWSARQPTRSANNDTAPRRATCTSRSSSTSRIASQSVQRTANGNARRRRLEISFPHS